MAGAILGNRLRRVPDGETGVRSAWIAWQHAVMMGNPLLEPEPEASLSSRPRVRLRAGVTARELAFGPLGYAEAARGSHADFVRVKRDGVLPPRCRFQVSLPTPLAVQSFVVPDTRGAVEPAYEARMLAEVNEIAAAVPSDQLAIQWDVAVEIGLWEGVWPTSFSDVKKGIIERLVRLADSVPAGVELGYHLCYGDAGHKHFKEPADTSNLVEIANAISISVRRPINWIHLPVPRARHDDAYYTPLRNLQLHPETELYLGLAHFTDGAEGTRRRIVAAQRVVPGFGVATECGLGRRAPATIPALLRIHAEVAGPVA